MSLTDIRSKCGSWDEEVQWCDKMFPSSCSLHEACKEEASITDSVVEE